MGIRSGRRLRIGIAALLLLACEAHATPPAPVSAPEPAGEERFDPEAIGFVVDSALDRARDALDRGDHAAARSLAETALTDATSLDAPRLHYVAARACLAAHDTPGAVAHFEAIEAVASHPLAAFATLEHAAAIEATNATDARRLASLASSVEFSGAGRARRIEARSQVAAGDRDGAVPLLRRLVREANGEALAELATPLIDVLSARQDAESIREALALVHRLYAKAPRTSAGRAATRTMETLARRLPRADRALSEPTLDERIERANTLAGARSEDALDAYDEVIAAMPESDARLCTARRSRLDFRARSKPNDESEAPYHRLSESNALDLGPSPSQL